MPWLKVSDTAGMHPMVLAPLTDEADDGLDPYDRANVLFGLVARCATMSASYLTDYVVADAVVMQVAGPRWQERAAAAQRAGYWSRVAGGWLIVDDSTNFVHIRKAAELEWERARKRDTSNPALVVPVRLRDGDGCRYCGVIVNWRARKGGRAGTYDHVHPGRSARGPDDLRVACRTCNSVRADRADADEILPPLPAPAKPFYGDLTVAMLAEHCHQVPAGTTPAPPVRPGIQPDTAHRDPASSRTPRTATRHPAGHRAHQRDPATSGAPRTPTPRPGTQPDTALPTPGWSADRAPPGRERRSSTDSADRRGTGSGFPGRDGTGSGRETAPSLKPQPARRRRARRSKPPPDQPQARNHH
jgi:5-methylcytosine-specific restriction endonuclease McrA